MTKPLHFLIAALLGVAVLACYLSGNLGNPYFWYDAAGQVFMSLGVDPFGAPFAGPGSLSDAIRLNVGGNMDPGGFTLLARFWAMISTDPAWLRTLPFVFLLAGLGFLFRYVHRATRDTLLTTVIALFPLTNFLIAQWGLTFRAYSMEMCGALAAACFCYEPIQAGRARTWIVPLALLAFFATSRYSFLFVIFAYAGAWVLSAPKQLKIRFSWGWFAGGLVAILPVALPLFRHAQHKVTYISRFVLGTSDLEQLREILQANFGRIEVLLQLAFFLVYAALPKDDEEKKTHRRFFWFLVLLNLCFVAVSILGVYPWYLSERYSITLNAVSYAAAASAVTIVLAKVRSRFKLPAGAAIALGVVLAAATSNFTLDPYTNTDEALTWAEQQGFLTGTPVFMSRGIFIDAKYLFEHGKRRGSSSDLYPSRMLSLNKDGAPGEELRPVNHAFVATADNGTTAFFKGSPDFELVKEYLHLRIYGRRANDSKTPAATRER